LRKLNSGTRHVKTWFNVGDDSSVYKMMVDARLHMTKMLQVMMKLEIKKGSSNVCTVQEIWHHGQKLGETGPLAFVRQYRHKCWSKNDKECGERASDGRYIMNICEFFWRGFVPSSFRVGTIVHEASHHFGTSDKGYCDVVDCLALTSRQARKNADTYTMLVQELVAATRLKEDSQAIAHTECNTICGASSYDDWVFDQTLSGDQCGRCHSRFFGTSCGDDERMAEGAMRKLCCSKYKCHVATTTTTTVPKLCPADSFPVGTGLCVCRKGFKCMNWSLECPSRGDGNQRQWFKASCSTCKCHEVQ
jgi:hypothetical protein